MKKLGLLQLLIVLFFLSSTAQTFTNLNLQGMGFVTGMKMHPSDATSKFIRTDVGGAYRFDAVNSKWLPITDGQLESYSIIAMAIDPTNSSNVWLVAGGSENNNVAVLYKSTDKGTTWTKSSTFPSSIYGNGNSTYFRWADYRLVIDSRNGGKLMLFGSEQNGLWKSTDAGVNWSQIYIEDLPYGTPDAGGITFCAINSMSGSSTVTSTTFYVGVVGYGVYETKDGGLSYTLIPGIDPADKPVSGMVVGGSLYVVTSDQVNEYNIGTSSKVYKYTGTGSFVDKSPKTWHSVLHGFAGIDVDPTNPNRVITVEWNPGDTYGIHITTDGGTNWTHPGFLPRVQAAWMPGWASWAYSSFIMFDRTSLNQVFVGTGFNVFSTPNITLSPLTWTAQAKNLEELCVGNLCVAPSVGGPALHIAFQDFIGMTIKDKTLVPNTTAFTDIVPPATTASAQFGIGTGIDYCVANPNVVAIVGSTENAPITAKAKYTIDGGTTWNNFPTMFTDAQNGNIAISATNESNWVWAPNNQASFSCMPNYTIDKGATWTQCAGLPTTKNEALHMWSAGTPLISDRVAANTFYYYIQSAGKTELYKSTDGGATFTKINTTLEANYAMKLKAVPGKQGHLFFYARSNGNLMHSTDAGTTFTAVSNVTSVKGIGFGKAIAPSTEPTVYLVGSINGIPGLYFSTNYCNTWNASPSSKLPIELVSDVSGDLREDKLVYFSTIGRGVLYTNVTAPTAVQQIAENNTNARIYSKNGQIAIDLSEVTGTSIVTVCDTKGSTIKSLNSSGSELLNINVANKGIYIVRVKNADKQSTQKIVLL